MEMPARGQLRTLRKFAVVRVARGPRAISRRGLAVAALAFSEGTLRCSLREGGCDDSASALNGPLHRAFSPTRRSTAGQTLSALRCSPAPMRPNGTPPPCPSSGGSVRPLEYTLRLPARLRAGGRGSEWAAPGHARRRVPAARGGTTWLADSLPARRAKGRVPQPPSRPAGREPARRSATAGSADEPTRPKPCPRRPLHERPQRAVCRPPFAG